MDDISVKARQLESHVWRPRYDVSGYCFNCVMGDEEKRDGAFVANTPIDDSSAPRSVLSVAENIALARGFQRALQSEETVPSLKTLLSPALSRLASDAGRISSAALSPQLRGTVNILGNHPSIARSLISPSALEILKTTSRAVVAPAMERLTIEMSSIVQGTWSNIALPTIDASWFPSFDSSWIRRLQQDVLRDLDSSVFDRLLESVRGRYRRLPPNWWDVTSPIDVDGDDVRTMLLMEGIPMAWVPSAPLIERLLNAENGNQRRQLITNGWRGIVNDCETAVGQLPSSGAQSHARFIRLCVKAIRDGHFETAQALAANLIDTLGTSFVTTAKTGHRWSLVTAKNQQKQLTRVEIRNLLVLGPLSVAHNNFAAGEEIPRTFTRHATAHGVSRRQYTRANALIAVMNATALLCWLERDRGAFTI